MILKNIKSKDQGFTIVELLVVIVVIGILAAITIVSYTGITARANSAATKQMAANVISKAGIYQTEGSTLNWPTTAANAMSATASSAAITGVSVNASTTTGLTAASMTTISYQLCGTTSATGGTVGTPAAAPATTYTNITNPTGIIVGYWDYGLSNPVQSTLSAGQISGTAIPSGTTSVNTIACMYTGL